MCILIKVIQSIVLVFKLKNKGGPSKSFVLLKSKMNVRTLSLKALKGLYLINVTAKREFLLYFIFFIFHILEFFFMLLLKFGAVSPRDVIEHR